MHMSLFEGSKVQTSWKRMFFCTFWHESVQFFEGLRQGTFSFVVLLRSSVCLKDPHWNTTDDERRRREKNEQKGFKGSSTGPPEEEITRVPLRDLRGEKKKIK